MADQRVLEAGDSWGKDEQANVRHRVWKGVNCRGKEHSRGARESLGRGRDAGGGRATHPVHRQLQVHVWGLLDFRGFLGLPWLEFALKHRHHLQENNTVASS